MKLKERVHDLEGREIIKSHLKGKILDVGFGGRPITNDAITLDNNPEVGPEILSEMEDMPVMNEVFDSISACHILEHTDKVIEVLKEFKRVLKKGGTLCIMVPHGEYVDSVDLGDTELKHKSLFSVIILKKYLEFVGFKVMECFKLERPLASQNVPAIIAIAKK